MASMYKKTDKLLAALAKVVKAEFLRLSLLPMDELNVVSAKKTTSELFDRLKRNNAQAYLSASKSAYTAGIEQSALIGFVPQKERKIDAAWVLLFLGGFNRVTGYLYEPETERKRLRLAEQILTAREYKDRQMYSDSVKSAAGLWWKQTEQYAIGITDEATIEAYRDAGVEYVKWITQKDERTCKTCKERDGVVYKIGETPEKTHYGCRCYVIPHKG